MENKKTLAHCDSFCQQSHKTAFTVTLPFKRLRGWDFFYLKLLNGSTYLFIMYITHIIMFLGTYCTVLLPQTLYEDIKSNHLEYLMTSTQFHALKSFFYIKN